MDTIFGETSDFFWNWGLHVSFSYSYGIDIVQHQFCSCDNHVITTIFKQMEDLLKEFLKLVILYYFFL